MTAGESPEEAVDAMLWLCDCERDSIQSGTLLSPTEQSVALKIVAQIEKRIRGHFSR